MHEGFIVRMHDWEVIKWSNCETVKLRKRVLRVTGVCFVANLNHFLWEW